MNFLQFLLTIFIIKQCFCNETTKVSLKQGVLLGKIEKTVYKKQEYLAYRGIPFADPPTGLLRFKPPQPHTGWEGELKAFKRKPTCMQLNTRGRLREPNGITGSEDCLYINVYTPNIKGKAPVIVFEYNDNFRTSFNGTATYSPDFFMEDGIIVATISSRLGIFGYLTTEDSVIPGNNGLRDFILGLEWIKNNIEEFGGDASKITLMGSHGGATISHLLLYSKKTKGLFSRAILQSGSSLEASYFIDKPKTKAFEIGKYLNLTFSNSIELLEGLQSLDADKLINADVGLIMSLDENEIKDTDKLLFVPTLEGEGEDAVLTALPENADIVNDVPVIIGFNSRVGADSISHYLYDPRLLTPKAEKTIFKVPIRTDFKFLPNGVKYKEANRAVLDFYYKDKSLYYGNLMEHVIYIGDVLTAYPLSLAAETMAKTLSSPVFFYVFDFRGLWNEHSELIAMYSRFPFSNTGALALDELCYLLVCSRIKKTYEDILNLPSEQPEIKVVKKMIRLWSNFARTGNPTPNKEDPVLKKLKWDTFSNETDSKYLHITKVLTMKNNPLGTRKQFWDELLDKYSKDAVNGVIEGDEVVEEEEEETVVEEVEEEVFDESKVQKEEGVDNVVIADVVHQEL